MIAAFRTSVDNNLTTTPTVDRPDIHRREGMIFITAARGLCWSPQHPRDPLYPRHLQRQRSSCRSYPAPHQEPRSMLAVLVLDPTQSSSWRRRSRAATARSPVHCGLPATDSSRINLGKWSQLITIHDSLILSEATESPLTWWNNSLE